MFFDVLQHYTEISPNLKSPSISVDLILRFRYASIELFYL